MPGIDLQHQLDEISERYGLDAVYVFGSRAREIAARLTGDLGRQPGSSDVDLGVQVAPERRLSVAEKADLTVEFEELFGVSRVDLVILQETSPFVALEVIRGELLSCQNARRQAEYELYILRRAGDLAYYERRRRRQILQEGGR